MFNVLYDFVVALFGLSQLPRQLLKRPRRTVAGWFARDFPSGDPERFRVLVHAVSVGETKAAAPLVQRIKAQVPDAQVLFSSVTATGHEEVQKRLGSGDLAAFFPLDLACVMRRALRTFTPDLVIITETDFWFRFLSEAKRLGARVVVVNGKLSERSLRGYRRLPFFKRRLFPLIDHFCLQEDLYRHRFAKLGIKSSAISVTGNLKFENPPDKLSEEQKAALKRQIGLHEGEQLLVIGSTHEGEEALLAAGMVQALGDLPTLRICLVPRHVERASRVRALLDRKGLAAQRFSEGGLSERVILVDRMGVLTALYQIASVAAVAGSFKEGIGGHNILEPVWFSVPVLYGPHMAEQVAMKRLVERFDAGEAIEASALADKVKELLEDPALYQKRQRAAIALVQGVRGSLDRTWKALEPFFPLSEKPEGS